MAPSTTRIPPALVLQSGELVPLGDTLPAISVAEAGELLPEIRKLQQRIRRYEGYLSDLLRADMQAKGQRERRIGDLLLELKGDAEYTVHDPNALRETLMVAEAMGEITPLEHQRACQVVSSVKWNHAVLNSLAKRLPAIDEYRKRNEGEPTLRIK